MLQHLINIKKLCSYQKEHIYTIIVFILISISILLKSKFATDGYVSGDSSYYLLLAQNLLDGKGFSYYQSWNSVNKMHFAVWPVGYPLLIYTTSKLTGLSVFWASKLTNILLIALIIKILQKYFKKNTYLYSLILLFHSYITIFTFTWSETAFIFGLFWFSTCLFEFINHKTRILSSDLIKITSSLLLSSLFLFISRYIGFFSIIVIGIFIIYFSIFKRTSLKFWLLILIISINTFFIIGYFYHNYLETGFTSGMPRIPAPESDLYLFKSLISAILCEFALVTSNSKIGFLSICIGLCISMAVVFRYREKIINTRNSNDQLKIPIPMPFILLLTGIIYEMTLIFLRWRTHFDDFSFRLIAPGGVLIFISSINLLELRIKPKYFNYLKITIIFAAIFSFVKNTPFANPETPFTTYEENVERIKREYKNIPKNSIILFGEDNLRYLRSDLVVIIPRFKPVFHKNESLSELFCRIKNKNNRLIYIVPPGTIPKNYDSSIIEFLGNFPPNTITKLDNPKISN
jgi:hypothetical protein